MDDDRDAAIQRLIDKDAIREVTVRYARGIDRHDSEIMASAYHPGATDDHGGYIGTAAGFIYYANEVHAGGFVAHQHYMTNQTIALDGDMADVETYYLAVLRQKGGGLMAVGGRYLDHMTREKGGWAIAHRSTTVEWSGELPELPTDALSPLPDRPLGPRRPILSSAPSPVAKREHEPGLGT